MKLFVYGTLKYPEIQKALTKKKFSSVDATLFDYKIVALKNKPYPGLIASNGSTTLGKIIDVDEESYKVIRSWEDAEYKSTQIQALSEGKNISALTFLHIFKPEQMDENWDENSFKNYQLKDYVTKRIPDFLKQNYSQRKTLKATK